MALFVDITKKLEHFTLRVQMSTKNMGVVGILGASGCGKSMTLRCIAGIEIPDSGKIILNGRVLYDSEKKICLPPQERKVGYLFQQYALFPHMTVRQNLEIVAGVAKTENEIAKYLALLHIEEIVNSYPEKLSGGQKQRVAMARMLLTKPELVLLDEPFSALDNYLKETLELEIMQLFQKLSVESIMVTHSREEAYRICTYLSIFERGQVSREGETTEVFRDPKTVAAAKLTGCKNIFSIKKKSEKMMDVPEIDLCFNFVGDIPEDITCVGIRAHDLCFREGEGENNLLVKSVKFLEDPFEQIVIINDKIWLKCAKSENILKKIEEGQRLHFPPQKLMLLK